MAELTRDSKLLQSESVLFSEVAGGVTLMNMDNAKYYHLDEVGAAIWNRIDGKSSVGEICSALLAEFETNAAECEADTLEFLHEISALQLVTVAG